MTRLLAFLPLLLCACTPSDEGPDADPTDTTDPTDTAGSALVSELTVVPVDPERLPLSFRLDLETTVETTVTLEFSGRTVTFDEPASVHSLPLLGFHADTTTPVDVRITDASGNEEVETVDVVTPPLPEDFPRFELLVHDPARMAPGYTVLVIRPGALIGPDSNAEQVVALDENAEVVWVELPEETVFDASVTEDGTLLWLGQADDSSGGPIVETTLLGEELARFQGTDSSGSGVVIDSLGFHHEIERRPDGRILTLSKEPFPADDYPTSYTDPTARESAVLSADVVVEFDPSGAITNEWHVSDWLPTGRIGYTGLETSHFDGLLDWTHGNAVQIDPTDDTILVSLRNQDAIVKLDESGEPVWILGTHTNWPEEYTDLLLEPQGDLEWFYKQHAPMISDDGHILVFDNGEVRSSPWDGIPIPPEDERYSRVVEYHIDESNGTVEQTWELKETTTGVLYSPVIGDADYLSNGNVLSCFGFVSHSDGVPLQDNGIGAHAVRIIESAPGDEDETVLDLRIYSLVSERGLGWTAYRADRVPDLYAWAD